MGREFNSYMKNLLGRAKIINFADVYFQNKQ